MADLDAERLGPAAFLLTDDGLSLPDQLRQRSAARHCANWIRDRVEIRSIRRAGLLHGKLIHVHDGAREHAMIGSSNFTLKGLGLTDAPNIELNLVVDGDRDRSDLLSWFNEIWSDESLVADVKNEVLRCLERLYTHNSPEFIYRKTLFHIFEDFLSDKALEDERFGSPAFTETAIWRSLYSFQRDGVRAVLTKLDRHRGCILADSVGLGKTFTALAVIKWHEMRNQRVLVLCPKKLRENWTEYLAANNSDLNPLREDRLAYTVLAHTDLNRERGHVGDIDLSRFNWAAFDLVVIDESHAFRNPSGTRYQRLLDQVILSGAPTRVLMLSATPVNNDLADLKAQLDLIAGNRSDAFRGIGVPNLTALIGTARRRFAEWSRAGGRDAAALMAKLPVGLTSLLDGVSIARSRRHIERHYVDTLNDIGRFPTRARPVSLFPGIDLACSFPAFDEVDRQISGLNLSLYNPFAFVLPEHQARYDQRTQRTAGFHQADREKYLITMMKAGLLKRLESSVVSFGQTMRRIAARIDARLADIEEFRRLTAKTLDPEPPVADDNSEGDEELAAAFEIGGRLKYDLQHLDVDGWDTALRQDRDRVVGLAAIAEAVSPERDAKLGEIRRVIQEKIAHPTRNRDGSPNRKVILFTAFADTARYLYSQLESFIRSKRLHVGMVTGTECTASLGRSNFQDVLANFAPRSKKRAVMQSSLAEEIDVLIATDCISEGQNLQDADLLINVDIHWNPVRLIQRFGRIDRIGALADTVRMVNFWPTDDLNRYLNLKDRVEARMALVDLSATGEDNLLAEVRDAAEGELHWRDEQLRRLQTEVFDLEEANDGVSLTEFTLDDFRADLLAYAHTSADDLRQAPLGLHAIVPMTTGGGNLDCGVIFCLRRMGAPTEVSPNPLDPFYLAYVRNNGSIRHGFAQPKSILAAFQALCAGRSQPIETLCNAFDDETEQGAKLDRYDALIRKALEDIGEIYATKAAASLSMGRGGKLPDLASQPRTDGTYQLVTWLIIRPEGDA